MAKDGTGRGGRRAGAGRKIIEGTEAEVVDLNVKSNLKGYDMPPVEEYMRQEQKLGIELNAEKIYRNTFDWLSKRGCIEYINPLLLQEYAMSAARWIQCNISISKFGFSAKHPTT